MIAALIFLALAAGALYRLLVGFPIVIGGLHVGQTSSFIAFVACAALSIMLFRGSTTQPLDYSGSLTMAELPASKMTVGRLIELILPLLLVTLLIGLCAQLLVPFVGLLIWTIILAVCFYPVHNRLKKRVSNRMSAIMIGLGLSAFVLVPTTIAAMSAAGSIPKVVAAIQTGEQQIPPPPARLQGLPIVGEARTCHVDPGLHRHARLRQAI